MFISYYMSSNKNTYHEWGKFSLAGSDEILFTKAKFILQTRSKLFQSPDL